MVKYIFVILLVITFGLMVGMFILRPHKRFESIHRAWFSLQDSKEIKVMWFLFGTSLVLAMTLFALVLAYIKVVEKPDNMPSAYATGVSFLVGLILNLVIYYWSFATNLAQARTTRLLEGFMIGTTTLGEDTLEQLIELRRYLDLASRAGGDNWLRMAIASPTYGILHSPEAVDHFLGILEDWLSVAENSNSNRLELVIWKKDIHRKAFGSDTDLTAWKKQRSEILHILAKLSDILHRIHKLESDASKHTSFKLWESKPSDYRICIAGNPNSEDVRAALVLYAPLDKELEAGAIKVDNLFFRYQKGRGLQSLVTMYDRHKGTSLNAKSVETDLYLSNPIKFLEDYYGIGGQDKEVIIKQLSGMIRSAIT